MAEPQENQVASLVDLFPDEFETIEPEPAGDREQDKTAIVRLSPAQEQKLLKQLRLHYDEAITTMEDNARRRELRYRRFLTDPALRDGLQPWEDAPRLFLPMTRVAIEKLVGEFEQALWDTFDKIQVQGFGEEDVEVVKRRRAFFQWQLEKVNKWRKEGKSVLQDALVDGLGILKAYPFRQPWKALHPDAEMFDVIGKIEAIDPGAMLIPPDAIGLQWPECRYLGHQMWPFLDEFPSMEARGFTLPDPELVANLAPQTPFDDFTDDERRLVGFYRDDIDPLQANYEHDPRVEQVEQYELFDIDDDGEREFIICHWFPNIRTDPASSPMTGHLSRVMKLEDVIPQHAFIRPMWPFFDVTLWPQARQLRGMNVPDRIESSQDILNRTAEQMIQAGEMELLPIVFANVALAGEIPDLTRVQPGTVVPIEGLGTAGQVQFSQRPSQTREFLQIQQVARSWGEEDTGVTALSQGRTPDQPNVPRTTSGLALLLQEGNQGRKQQTVHLASQFTQAFIMLHSVWQQRIPKQVRIPMPQTGDIENRLLGDEAAVELITVRREDISGLFDIVVKANPDAVLEMQRKLALSERLDALLTGVWPFGRRELWKEVWESFGLKEFDRFYPEEVSMVQTQIVLAQAMAQLAQLGLVAQQAQAASQPSPLAAMAGGEQPAGGQAIDGGIPSQGQAAIGAL